MHRGDDAGKIFVGGLSYETTTEGLEDYFSKFGDVADCVIMKAKDPNDPRVERSRGFGFVTFRDPTCVQKVIDNRPHFLDNKEIDPKPAVPRAPGQQVSIPKSSGRSFKCFIGGIPQGTSEEDLKAFFSSFGPVSEVTLMKDVKTGRMRGFGFVGFHTEDAVQKICAIRFHQVNGKTVEAKKAEPRDSRTPSVIGGNMVVPSMGRGMQQVQQQQYMAGGYGMNSYGQADARSLYGGYPGQATQANPYGVAGASAAASPYSNYVSANGVSAVQSSYPDRAAGLGQDPAAVETYAGTYGATMGMYGAIGAPTSAARYEFATTGLGPPTSTQGAGMPGRADASEFGSYGSYGLGSYAQEASQYGPTRGGIADSGFGAAAAAAAAAGGAAAAAAANVYGGEQQSYPVGIYDSMGRGGSNATRGYHPYGR